MNRGPCRRRVALATSAPRFRVCADMGELCTAPIETQPGVMFTGPNWKQLGSVGSQAAPSWTTALPSGGPACQGPIALPGRGPGSHPATRILHRAGILTRRRGLPVAHHAACSAPQETPSGLGVRAPQRGSPRGAPGSSAAPGARAVSSMRSISRPRGTFVGVAPNTDRCWKLNRQDVATSVQRIETAITCGAPALLRHEKL